MQIGGDYPRPVMVNGYPCRNCDEVSLARRGVDPQTPGGPQRDTAVQFGGTLSQIRPPDAVPAVTRLIDRLA